jgi:hypothetical protein
LGEDALFTAMLCDSPLSLSLSPPFSCSTDLEDVSSETKERVRHNKNCHYTSSKNNVPVLGMLNNIRILNKIYLDQLK